MSDLTNIDKLKLEKFFGMASGYVLDFSNRTFQEFILDSIGFDIYDAKYDYVSGSKANRLRAFWTVESNFLVAKLLTDLLEYWTTNKHLRADEISQQQRDMLEECESIVERLGQNVTMETEAIRPYSTDKTFTLLAESIRDSIRKNEPEPALDRLHTFTVKYIRYLCDCRGISYDRGIPLHGLFGRYVKYLRIAGLIESEMTARILKSSISMLESFNKVRNEQSLAHDNPLLNYDEAMLIFNNIAASIRFLESIEKNMVQLRDLEKDGDTTDEIPF